MFGGSFSEQQLYSSKCFLMAIKESHDCLREAARHRSEQELSKTAVNRLLEAKRQGLVEFQDGKVVKGKSTVAQSLVFASIQAALTKSFTGFEKSGDYQTAKSELEKAVTEIGK